MFTLLYRDPRFDKGLKAIRRSGKKGAAAATRAEAIIDLIQRQGHILPHQLGTCYRLPDARLANGTKYYMGNGFRMVTVEAGEELFLVYIGAHDSCHRWVENNRNLQLEPIRQRSRPYQVMRQRPKAGNGDTGSVDADIDSDDAPPPELDDRLLREIFAGLCEAS